MFHVHANKAADIFVFLRKGLNIWLKQHLQLI